MRLRNLGENNPNYGKPRSEATKRKIGTANKISQLGNKHSEITKQKMSKSHQQDIPILCIETGIVYSCPSEAGASVEKEKTLDTLLKSVVVNEKLLMDTIGNR